MSATKPEALLLRHSEADMAQMLHEDAACEPALPPHVVASLGERLRGYYSHLMSESVPDHLVQLLERMDRGETGHGA